ncbi:unnamed protein product [Scytosiphon promiscuus]
MLLYESLVRRLYQVNLFHPAKMGLTNIQRLHEALGNPADSLPAVHIAGTNGKGSVAFKMARSLQLGGLKTGLFVSPHVSCFRERMQVDGNLISEASVESILPRLFDLCESQNIPATFFELTTALAFQYFRESGVDAIVVETGLGGRLDATNILKPKMTVITSVGLDHTNILGNTVELIAMEKAGIMKPGIPALVGDGCPVELLKEVAESRGCPFHRWTDAFPEGHSASAAATGDAGDAVDFDAENSRLAEAALILLGRFHPDLLVDEDAVRRGVSQRPPCRFEVLRGGRGGDLVMDVAHNPPAIARFFEKVAREFPGRRVRVVAAFSSDKDAKVCLKTILKHADPERIHLAEASTPRAASCSVLASALADLSGGKFDPSSSRVRRGNKSVGQAVRDAVTAASLSGSGKEGSGGGDDDDQDVVVVCGTVFMMVDAREELGIDEPRDSAVVAEVAGSHFRSAQDNMGSSKKKG